MRRRRDARRGARRALEQAREGLGRALAGRGLQHRADQRAHHVAQERVGLDAEHELVAATLPVRRQHDAAEDLVLGLRGREGAEVVLAEQRPRHTPRAPPAETSRGQCQRARGAQRRRARACAARGTRRGASAPRSARGSRRDACEQRSTATSGGRCALSAAATRAISGPALGRVDRHDLCRGVHARVGAAGHGRAAAVRPEHAQRVGQHALDRAQARLRGPAVELRAVVLDVEPEDGHRERSSRRWRGGSRRSTSAQRPPPAPITIRASKMMTGGNVR